MTGLEALRATIDALDAAQAPYMLTGSFASTAKLRLLKWHPFHFNNRKSTISNRKSGT